MRRLALAWMLVPVFLTGCAGLEVFWPPINPEPAPAPVPGPAVPDVVVPADFSARVKAAFGPGGKEAARKYAALYAAASDEAEVTQVPLPLFRAAVAKARKSLGIHYPALEPALEPIVIPHLEPYSAEKEWTPANRQAFGQAIATLSAACMEASH